MSESNVTPVDEARAVPVDPTGEAATSSPAPSAAEPAPTPAGMLTVTLTLPSVARDSLIDRGFLADGEDVADGVMRMLSAAWKAGVSARTAAGDAAAARKVAWAAKMADLNALQDHP